MRQGGPFRRGRTPGFRLGLPIASGMRVGLYGGSFNPAHAGHAHVADVARRRLGLDRVVWLVASRNPLKTQKPVTDLEQRMAKAARLARGPGMVVSDVERRLGTRYTIDTLRALKARYPAVRFVWIMGADSLADFHRWRDWTGILREVPVAVVARPGHGLRALTSPAARRFPSARLAETGARGLSTARTPAWIWLAAPLNPLSSTALRECS